MECNVNDTLVININNNLGVMSAKDMLPSGQNLGTNGNSYDDIINWSNAQACHAPGTTVVDAFVVTDSGWLNGAYSNLIDNVQFDGITYGASANG